MEAGRQAISCLQPMGDTYFFTFHRLSTPSIVWSAKKSVPLSASHLVAAPPHCLLVPAQPYVFRRLNQGRGGGFQESPLHPLSSFSKLKQIQFDEDYQLWMLLLCWKQAHNTTVLKSYCIMYCIAL